MDQNTHNLLQHSTRMLSHDNKLQSIQYKTTGQDFSKIAYSSSLNTWVVVGSSGTIAVSKNGTDWELITVINNSFSKVIFANGLFVAVAGNSILFSSHNGYDWRQRTNVGSGLLLRDINFYNGVWVALAPLQIYTSTDLNSWSVLYNFSTGVNLSVQQRSLQALRFSNNRFITTKSGYLFSTTDLNSLTRIDIGSGFTNCVYTGSYWLAITSNVMYISSDGITWTINSSIPTGITNFNSLISVANGNVFINTTGAGLIISTDGGLNFSVTTGASSAGTSSFVVFGNNTYLCYSSGTTGVFTSTDGINWTQRSFGVSAAVNSAVYANGLFVILVNAASNNIRTSPDGVTWSTQISNAAVVLRKIAYAGTTFVVVGASGTIRTSTTGTGTWNSPSSGTTNQINDVAYITSLGLWVAVGNGTSSTIPIILTSPDAATWTARSFSIPINSTFSLTEIHFYQNTIVAIGASDVIVTSTDGINWTARSYSFGLTANLDYSGNTYVIVGASGEILTSPDLLNWTPRPSGVTTALNYVIYKNNQWMCVGNSAVVLQSTDAITWNLRSNAASQTTANLQNIDFGNNTWCAVGTSGAIITSTNTINWTAATNTSSGSLVGVAYNNNLWVSVGAWGVIQSSDTAASNTWTRRSNLGTISQPLGALYSVVYANFAVNPVFIAVGLNGLTLTSSDGINWTPQSNGTNTLRKVDFLNGVAVAVGASGTIRRSSDGVTWTSVTNSGTTNTFNDITYGLIGGVGTWVAVGDSGTIRTSTEANFLTTTWTTSTSNHTDGIYCVAYGNNYFVTGNYTGTLNHIRYNANPASNSWTAATFTGAGTALTTDIEFVNGVFFAVGAQNWRSSDGITWAEINSYYDPTLTNTSSLWYANRIVTNNQATFYVGLKTLNNKQFLWCSLNSAGGNMGSTFVNNNDPTLQNWVLANELRRNYYAYHDIAFGNGKYVLVGRLAAAGTLGTIAYSTI